MFLRGETFTFVSPSCSSAERPSSTRTEQGRTTGFRQFLYVWFTKFFLSSAVRPSSTRREQGTTTAFRPLFLEVCFAKFFLPSAVRPSSTRTQLPTVNSFNSFKFPAIPLSLFRHVFPLRRDLYVCFAKFFLRGETELDAEKTAIGPSLRPSTLLSALLSALLSVCLIGVGHRANVPTLPTVIVAVYARDRNRTCEPISSTSTSQHGPRPATIRRRCCSSGANKSPGQRLSLNRSQ